MVKRISVFVCVAALCWWAGAGELSASDLEPSDPLYTKGRASVQLASGALFSLTGFPEGSPTLNYAQANLRFGWMLTSPGPGKSALRGNWEGIAEITNSIIFKGPGSYMGGITLLFRYNFVQPGWDLVPFIQGGAGIVYNDVYKDETQTAIGQAIEFTPQCSMGLQYLISRSWGVSLEAMFHHISNAGMSRRNNSINSLGGFLGVTYFFDQILD
ncbi:MAG TPA: acyloxyacyl hydrolase [Deltaproteobacteria bacterium]|nr:acyloxyacyl hydrolase [Deltaproteobacteria bacterium]